MSAVPTSMSTTGSTAATDSTGSTAATDSTATDDYQARLLSYVGQPSGPPLAAPDQVNQAMIRHWVEAMGDDNPVYVDEEAARQAGFPGVIAPPTMLQAWVMQGLKATQELEAARLAGTAPTDTPNAAMMNLLDEGGFTSVVATNCEQHYVRPLVLGDRVTVRSVIESISGEKATGLGVGHFVTTRMDFVDAADEPVATMRFRILKYRPGTARSAGSEAPATQADAGRAGDTVSDTRHEEPA